MRVFSGWHSVLVLAVLCFYGQVVHGSSRGVARELLGDSKDLNKTLPSVSYTNIRFESSSPVDTGFAEASAQSQGIGSWFDRKKHAASGSVEVNTTPVDQARSSLPVSGAAATGVSAAGGSAQQYDVDDALLKRQQLLEQLLEETERELSTRS